MSPTQRSKQALRDKGWYPEVVEYWSSWTKRRHDMLGFVDIFAMKDGERTVLIQTTTGTNFAARKAKILASDLALLALKTGHLRIVIHGWRKLLVKRGGKKRVWSCKEEEVTLDQILGDAQ